MILRKAMQKEFYSVRDFYWNLIEMMKDQNDIIGWKKGIYPSDEFLSDSIDRNELYVLDGNAGFDACVIINSSWNEGYEGCPWNINCSAKEIIVPHALAVDPSKQNMGVGKIVVGDIIDMAREYGYRAIRLDILTRNKAAEMLYTSMGFQLVLTKKMFYEDTGLTEYSIYELVL